MPSRILASALITLACISLSAQGTHAPVVQRGEYKPDAGAAAAHVLFLKLRSDASCRVTINGKTELLKPGAERIVRLPVGTFPIDIVDAADASGHAYGDEVVVDDDKVGKSITTDIYFHEVPVQKETEISEVSRRDEVLTVVEQAPEYPGGDAEMMKFIQKNLNYPKMDRDNGIQGKVMVDFVVNTDGSVSDVVVKRTVSVGIDKEAVRVAKLLHFKPGMQHGKPARVHVLVPVVFKLN